MHKTDWESAWLKTAGGTTYGKGGPLLVPQMVPGGPSTIYWAMDGPGRPLILLRVVRGDHFFGGPLFV